MKGSARAASEYVPIVRKLPLDEFCRQNPHPVLIFFSTSKKLKPNKQSQGLTIDHLSLSDSGGTGTGTGRTRGAYLVFPIVPCGGGEGGTTVGCRSSCDVQIDDASISKHHATIETRRTSHWITDNKSSGGTEVNGEALDPDEPRQLVSGAGVRLGDVDLIFLEAPEFYTFIKRFFGE
ncbi:MAG: FHA domain-containing protein [Deltaproteobacteria bacterium]|nr:FHA domain-containing protein [Deltaproteobacteria bacterium]